jgi:hypothetical protein
MPDTEASFISGHMTVDRSLTWQLQDSISLQEQRCPFGDEKNRLAELLLEMQVV